jgi:hypothetical protein
MKTITAKRYLTEKQGNALSTKFLDNSSFDTLITEDCDAYDTNGELLFRFRKGVIPLPILEQGYNAFKDSIQLTDGRGNAAGGNHKRVRADGTISNISIADKVYSGNVGYMDAGAMVKYCRKTAFARQYFDKFKQGIPFVEFVSGLYEQLCPDHFESQQKIANGTDINYMIGNSVFTTVTVNRNFQTAVHKDSGDYSKGFGNLCVYRIGDYKGSYFVLPEYRVAVDLHSTDMLFADVHRWHGNTPFEDMSEDAARIAFVMYYREYMVHCSKPSEELFKTKMDKTGFLKL